MDAVCSSSSLRIVIVLWLAFGHLLPCLELAERLASHGHRVSYVSTPRNLARLPPLHPNAAGSGGVRAYTLAPPLAAGHVELVELPFPRIDGLAEGAESTHDVADEDRELHWKAFDDLAAPFAEFLAAACADEATRPHWIVADCFHHWAAAAALEHKVPCAALLPTAAVMASPPAMTNSTMSNLERCLLTQERCTVAAIWSCVEWEPETFPLVQAIVSKPVVSFVCPES